jgi:hypothetical protein
MQAGRNQMWKGTHCVLEDAMSTILIILVLVLLFGGGGYYGFRRW